MEAGDFVIIFLSGFSVMILLASWFFSILFPSNFKRNCQRLILFFENVFIICFRCLICRKIFFMTDSNFFIGKGPLRFLFLLVMFLISSFRSSCLSSMYIIRCIGIGLLSYLLPSL